MRYFGLVVELCWRTPAGKRICRKIKSALYKRPSTTRLKATKLEASVTRPPKSLRLLARKNSKRPSYPEAQMASIPGRPDRGPPPQIDLHACSLGFLWPTAGRPSDRHPKRSRVARDRIDRIAQSLDYSYFSALSSIAAANPTATPTAADLRSMAGATLVDLTGIRV